MKDILINKGELVMLSSGEYSDYSVSTVCRALTDIDIVELDKEYSKIEPEEERWRHHYRFINWLVNVKKCVEEVRVTEWHMGERFLVPGEIDPDPCSYWREMNDQ